MCSMYYTDFLYGSALILGVKLDFCSPVGRVDEQGALQTTLCNNHFSLY